MDKTHTFTAAPEDASTRRDVFLASRLPELTRSRIKALLEEGRAAVHGKTAKAGQKLRAGEEITISVPAPVEGAVEAEKVALDVLYDDDDVVVVNKPAGMAVHPGAGRSTGTLVNALLGMKKPLAPTGGPLRPGIVHRLDKDTTGVLVVARNDRSYHLLTAQFKERTSSRKYLCLVWGSMRADEGTIDLAIGRDSVHRKKISTKARHKREAVTRYRVLKRFPLISLLEIKLETGRTHQIRVHLAEVKHPVVGDQVYGKRAAPPALPKAAADRLKGIKRQMLHAATLGFTHPATREWMEFSAPPPLDMAGLIEALKETSSE
ncbi:Ribosomal large subunit pseudouridine synthase D [Planctomycetaceae bacterium]|nr:Ribosomal large subunit pseudouridine synthase D [Planctomycetaceae bacterium]